MIYVESEYSVSLAGHRGFHHAMKHDLLPVCERHGMRLKAAWRGITGYQYTSSNLWEYDNFTEFEQIHDKCQSDPDYHEAVEAVRALADETTEVFSPLRFHPVDGFEGSAEKRGVLMTARISYTDGDIRTVEDRFLNIFLPTVLPILNANGMKFIAALNPIFGRHNRFLDIWRYDGLAEWSESLAAIGREPAIRKWSEEQVWPVIPTETVQLHVPVDYSPLR
jgi:NIPSNAP